MPTPITDGAQLVRELRKSGTTDSKLKGARACLQAAHNDKRKASAAEVLEALQADAVPDGTIHKARGLMECGEVPPAAGFVAPIEDQILEEAERTKTPGVQSRAVEALRDDGRAQRVADGLIDPAEPADGDDQAGDDESEAEFQRLMLEEEEKAKAAGKSVDNPR